MNKNRSINVNIDNYDNPDNIYSIRNKTGFYQDLILKKQFTKILNRNKIYLSNFKNIIDLGCGNGKWLREIANIRGSSKGLTGIDTDEKRLNIAKNINSEIQYKKMNILNIKYNDNTFDLAAAFVSFMFIKEQDNLEKAFKEVSRILKPGGYFIFYDKTGKNKNNADTRGFKKKEVIKLAAEINLKLKYNTSVFKLIFGIKKLNTAYLPDYLSLEILLLIERIFLFPAGNMFLLFKKEV